MFVRIIIIILTKNVFYCSIPCTIPLDLAHIIDGSNAVATVAAFHLAQHGAPEADALGEADALLHLLQQIQHIAQILVLLLRLGRHQRRRRRRRTPQQHRHTPQPLHQVVVEDLVLFCVGFNSKN